MTTKKPTATKSKEQISEAMKKLLKERRFSKITIEDITGQAGVSRQSFYRNFYDKYDVVTHIYKEQIEQSKAEHGIISLHGIGIDVLKFYSEYSNFIKDIGCDFGNPNPFMVFWFNYTREHYDKVIGKSKITPDMETAMTFYFHACYFMHYEFACENLTGTPETVMRAILNLMPDVLKPFFSNE